ncbi:Hint domain-containing protein [Roseivivax isoporae]|uniref:Hedgehog/Intein (Hint) domain-containing protein n=1 Tax=Roseivivax isoporae LMG 25204 TaxID=1449351 RepID=X7FB30_9RHOB|nr:Hint domain-containing protein [Roseivivax isoporae]ETX30092.1 hypothetical protein RISW2_18035 [Roseivivax isoporae LMG 25204]
MRRYEAAALMPDLGVAWSTHTAPAIPAFEEATSAFARGTLVQTVGGPVAIEDLLPGDYVETARGPEPVIWIGSTTFVPNAPAGETMLTGLTRVLSEGFGAARPAADIVLGPAARMVVENGRLRTLIGQSRVLVPVSHYADGDRLLPITPAGSVQLYHLMLRRHGTIRVSGIEVETYHPGTAIKRQLGDALADRFLAMFPNVERFDDFGDLSLPRTTREVLDGLSLR